MDAKCLLLRHLFFQTSNHTFPLDLPGRAEATAARDRKRTTKRMLWHKEMGGSGYFGAFFTVGEAQGEVSKARKLGRRLSNLEVEQNAIDRSINGENEREKNNSRRALLTSPGLMLVLRPRLLRAGLDEPDG